MIARLAGKFVSFQISAGIIKEGDYNIYQYGYTMLVEIALNLVVSVCLGICLRQIKSIIFFFFIFLPLRSYCGGYHANKAWKCVLLSNAVAFGVVEAAKSGALEPVPQWVKYLGAVSCSIIILCFSPADNENRKLGERERKVYRTYATVVLVFEILLEHVLLFTGNIDFYYIVLLSHAVQAIFLICASVKRPVFDG